VRFWLMVQLAADSASMGHRAVRSP